MMTHTRDDRWHGRPVHAAALRAFVFLAPVTAAAATSALVARLVNGVAAPGPLALRWAEVIVSSTLVLLITDRLARRLLPLAVLLRWELAFPGAVPSRLAVARSAANLRGLEERVRIARTTEFEEDPAEVAEMMLSLVAAVEAHDSAARGHAERVRVFAELIGSELKLYSEDADRLRWVALLHDVGKLEVPVSVLNKPGPLDARELEVVRRHPEDGARFTKPLHAWLGEWADAITSHHERWDGRGYPNGTPGSEISLGARIIAVADTYEAITAARPYHRPKTPAAARRELLRCAGTQFDPAVVHAFLEVPAWRLRFTGGVAAWVAQEPMLRGLDRVTAVVGRVASAAAIAGGALAVSIAGATLHR